MPLERLCNFEGIQWLIDMLNLIVLQLKWELILYAVAQ